MSGKQTIAHAQRQAANSGCLRRLVGRFGVKACYKSLTQVHGFDPEIAWLAIWYSRHHALPRRMGWAMDTRGVTAAPMTHAEATGFLDEYTNNRGRWSAPNTCRQVRRESEEANG
jgi:hypothetical protein